MTAEELEKRNIDALGEALGKQYTALNSEVTLLHHYWKEYLALFGTNQKRIDRMNQAAPILPYASKRVVSDKYPSYCEINRSVKNGRQG